MKSRFHCTAIQDCKNRGGQVAVATELCTVDPTSVGPQFGTCCMWPKILRWLLKSENLCAPVAIWLLFFFTQSQPLLRCYPIVGQSPLPTLSAWPLSSPIVWQLFLSRDNLEICARQDFASAFRRQLRGVEFFDVLTTGFLIKKLHLPTDPRKKSLKSPENSWF